MALSREVKVGAFVFAGLAVAGLVIFLIGDERHAFESKERYYAVFEDVQGLSRGSPVRMGGVDIGFVGGVGYAGDPKDSRLHVSMDIVKEEARRIRVDSTATISNKGLLGDKMVVVSVGSQDKAPLPPESEIKSVPPTDFGAIADRLGAISEKADAVMTNLQHTTDTFADPGVRQDLADAVHSLGHILKTVDTSDGYVGRLLKDPAEANRLSESVRNLDQATAQLDHLLAGLNVTVARVNGGPGFAHDVLYGEGPTNTVSQIGHAADELATTLEGERKGNGIAHSLLYGDDATQQLVGDLNAIAHDARGIVDGIKAGRGTLGALAVDPSVYEDIKMLLGNVQRNKTLRALVRYSIERDEKVAPAKVTDVDGPPAAAAPAPRGGAATGGALGASEGLDRE